MMKRFLPILFLISLLFSACSQAGESPAPESANSSNYNQSDESPQENTMADQAPSDGTATDEVSTDSNDDTFVSNALKKLQVIWTSAGHSQSESWIIEDLIAREYMAIWEEDMSGPTDEYELRSERLIESIESDTGQWDGEFVIHFMDSGLYYVYKDLGDEIMLECHWDEGGSSMTDSMIKDDSKRIESFPKAISDNEASYKPSIDISQCDSFEDIIDVLEDGRGYAQVQINGYDLLLVSSGTFFNGNREIAIDADIYCYVNDVPQYIGSVSSNTLAYPLSIRNNMLLCGGNHWGAKYTVNDHRIFPVLQIYEDFDTSGNASYFYSIGNVEKQIMNSREEFDTFNEYCRNAEVVAFETKEHGNRAMGEVALNEDQTDEMTKIAYGLLRILTSGTYTREQLIEYFHMYSESLHPLGTVLWFLYYPMLTQTELRQGTITYTCGYYPLDEPKTMLKDLFSWNADLSLLPTDDGHDWDNWGTLYDKNQLLLYMSGIGMVEDCEFKGLFLMDDGTYAFHVEQGIQGFDYPGEITIYLVAANNSRGYRIVKCDVEKQD